MPRYLVAFSLKGSVPVEAPDTEKAAESVGNINLAQYITETVVDFVEEAA